MKKIFSIAAFTLFAFAAISLTGCSKSTKKTSVNNDEGEFLYSAEQTAERTDVNIYCRLEPTTLDIHKLNDVSISIISRNINATLYRLNSEGYIISELASHYSVNNTYDEYTITLKKGLKFSDGSPLTSEDVKFSFERGKMYNIDFFQSIDSIEVIDERSVLIKLNNPTVNFLSNLAADYMAIISKSAMEKGMNLDEMANVTSGYYYVEEWKKGEFITLKVNPFFHDNSATIQTAKILYKLNEENSYKALIDGTVDYIPSVVISEVPYLKAADDVDLMCFDNFSWNYMILNQKDPHFADRNVRMAIFYALDLDYLINVALNGYGTPAPIPVNKSITGYVNGYDEYEFNLRKAKEFMVQSAYPNGFRMVIEVSTSTRAKMVEAMKPLLNEIGINVILKESSPNDLRMNLETGNYSAVITSYSFSNANVTFGIPLFRNGSNMHYSNGKDDDIAQLLIQSEGLSNTYERNLVLSKAYQRMNEERSYIGLYWPTVFDATNKSLHTRKFIESEKFNVANLYWASEDNVD